MQKILTFLQYHNAVPIALGVLFLGAGATFAATNPQAIYSAQQKVVSIDNTYIASKDLSTYTPRIEITSVIEDTDTYYISYNFLTVDVQDSVWRDVSKSDILTVQKEALGEYGDLGLYAQIQFSQLIDHEIERLKENQQIALRDISQKMVATAYSGLVGKFLDDTTEVVPGYTPVVTAPAPPPPPREVASSGSADDESDTQSSVPPISQQAPLPTRAEIEQLIRDRVAELLAQGTTPAPSDTGGDDESGGAGDDSSSDPPASGGGDDPSSEDTEPPAIVVTGDDPASINVGDTYSDQGATATDNVDQTIDISVSVDGIPAESVTLDTSVAGTHTIEYSATDQAGNTGTATRSVEVVAPAAPEPPVAETPPVPESETPPVPESETPPEEPATP